MLFADRREAGRLLAEELAMILPLTERPRLVAALPRGGVVVGAEIAAALKLPLEILVTRKIGAPGQPELAIGAVAQNGTALLNEELISRVHIPRAYIEAEQEREKREIERRLDFLRGGRPSVDWRDREVIVVDDGIATGFTVRAAVRGLHAEGVAAICLAVPVASIDAAESLSVEVDRLVALATPRAFYAVGQFYRDFSQVEDWEVRKLLSLFC